MATSPARLTPEKICAAVFAAQSNPKKKGLLALFHWNAGDTVYSSLDQAIKQLVTQGMSKEDGEWLGIAVQDYMGHKLPEFVMRHIMESPADAQYGIVINNVDWNPKYFLGVALLDPKIDIRGDKQFINDARAEFTESLRRYMDTNKTVFQIKPAVKSNRHGRRNFGLTQTGA